MSRPTNQELITRLRSQLQACESRARLALLAATEIHESLTQLAMGAPIIALEKINPPLQAAHRLVRLLRGEEVQP